MKRFVFITVLVFALVLVLGKIMCYASEISDPEIIIIDKIILSNDTFQVTVNLQGHTGVVSNVFAELYDDQGRVIKKINCAPSAEIDLELPSLDNLRSAVITWSKENGDLVCDPITITFDRIYAADWQALATATHRMDSLYVGKVLVEDDSSEYSSGRLIVKSKTDLPDVSEFDVAMIVADDENHYFLQFETSGEAKKCAEYLKLQPGIEYVDIDSVVTVSE